MHKETNDTPHFSSL